MDLDLDLGSGLYHTKIIVHGRVDQRPLWQMNIIIITCPHLFSKRLPTLFESIYKLKLEEFIDDIHIINMNDELLNEMHLIQYHPSQWTSDIQKGWPAFYYNIFNIVKKTGKSSPSDSYIT
mgnify:CR=1 FL=1